MKASNVGVALTVILAGVGAFFAGPGLGVLVGIVGTVLVVVLAWREENEKARDARRRVLREAAWRAMRENGEQA
jgi:type II secretory pathway component PulF